MAELLSVADLEAAKKQDTFHSEVITGKAGGVAGGADIDFSTNTVTGQVQKTLPKLLADIDWSYVGLFADGVTFTKRSDFAVDALGVQWVYVGAYPFTAIAGTSPTEPDYQVIHTGSLQNLTGLTDPSDLAQRHRIKTTVAEIATGIFKVGDLLEVSDRDNAPFNVVTGGSGNSIDILAAGVDKTAVMQDAKKQSISAFGGYEGHPDVSTILDRMVAVKGDIGIIQLDDGGYTGTLTPQSLYGIGLVGLGEGATKLVTKLSSGDGIKVLAGKQFRSVEIKDVGFTQSTYITASQGTGSGINLSAATTSVNYRLQNVSLNYFGVGVNSSANAFNNQFDNVRANFCTTSFSFAGNGQLINHTLNNCYSSQPQGTGLYMAGCKNFVFNGYNSGSAGFPHVNIAGGSYGIIFNTPNFEQDTGTLGSNTEAIRCQSDSEVVFNYPTFASPKSVDGTTYLFRVMNTAVVYINSPKIVGADANIKHILIQDTATVYLDDPKGVIDRSKVVIIGSGKLIDVSAANRIAPKAQGVIASHAAGATIATGLITTPVFWDVKINIAAISDATLDVQAQVTQVGTGILKVRYITISTGAQNFGSYPIIWEAR
jgi:hypothetical protein